jgi:microsomal dipeptidase-like Zn-dependent dipeptidase
MGKERSMATRSIWAFTPARTSTIGACVTIFSTLCATATAQPANPCGLFAVGDPSRPVALNVVAKPIDAVSVHVAWSGPAGAYDLHREPSGFSYSISLKPLPTIAPPAGVVIARPVAGDAGRPIGMAPPELVPGAADDRQATPNTHYTYVIRAALDDGRTACGFAATTTPSQPPVKGDGTPVGASSWTPALRGFADLHNHQFANLAYGGRFLVGRPFGPIDDALSSERDRIDHGLNHSLDIVGAHMGDWKVPSYGRNGGANDFAFWPSVREIDHQKVHEDWLKRAVDGGLRLMVMSAVDNPELCRSVNNDGRNCDDQAASVRRQVAAAVEMQNDIDARSDGPGTGWYRIVRSPSEARGVMLEGKLAVVLGVETADPPGLFGALGGAQGLRTQGIRHVFPIHVKDNAMGGASYFQPRIQHQANVPGDAAKVPLGPFTQKYNLTTTDCSGYEATGNRCNAAGLSTFGKAAVRELMRAGLVIDVDHMSDKSFADALDIAEELSYPAMVASHAGFNAINRKHQSHEGQLTREEYARMVKLGGMVALITGQGETLDDVAEYVRPQPNYLYPGAHTRIAHQCGRSSQTFAQAYLYAIDNTPKTSAVAIGSDFGGPLLQPGPRFPPDSCLGGVDSAAPTMAVPLVYPFVARGPGLPLLPQMPLGPRTVDFNYEGMTTVGQLPDLIADLEVLGVRQEELDPLYHSAEAYVEMWEKAEMAARKMPRPMALRVNGLKSTMQAADSPTQTFSVSAEDLYFETPLQNGQVLIDGQPVGVLGSPITYTFRSRQLPQQCVVKAVTDPATGRSRRERECVPARREFPPVTLSVRAAGFVDGSRRIELRQQ